MRTVWIEVLDSQRAVARSGFRGFEHNRDRALASRGKTGCAGIAADFEIRARGNASDTQRVSGGSHIAEGHSLRGAGGSDFLRRERQAWHGECRVSVKRTCNQIRGTQHIQFPGPPIEVRCCPSE